MPMTLLLHHVQASAFGLLSLSYPFLGMPLLLATIAVSLLEASLAAYFLHLAWRARGGVPRLVSEQRWAVQQALGLLALRVAVECAICLRVALAPGASDLDPAAAAAAVVGSGVAGGGGGHALGFLGLIVHWLGFGGDTSGGALRLLIRSYPWATAGWMLFAGGMSSALALAEPSAAAPLLLRLGWGYQWLNQLVVRAVLFVWDKASTLRLR